MVHVWHWERGGMKEGKLGSKSLRVQSNLRKFLAKPVGSSEPKLHHRRLISGRNGSALVPHCWIMGHEQPGEVQPWCHHGGGPIGQQLNHQSTPVPTTDISGSHIHGSFLPRGSQCPVYISHHRLDLLVPELCIYGIMQDGDGLLCINLLFLKTVFLKFIHVAAGISNSFLFDEWYSIKWIHDSLFILLLKDILTVSHFSGNCYE